MFKPNAQSKRVWSDALQVIQPCVDEGHCWIHEWMLVLRMDRNDAPPPPPRLRRSL